METHAHLQRRSRALQISAAALIYTSALPFLGQQQLARTELPSAPKPEPSAMMTTRPPAAPQRASHRINLNTASILFLSAGEALDSWTTYKNLTHQKWICGYSPAFGNAVTYISDDGRRYDPQIIQYDLCGPGPSGQVANYAYDVTRTGAFTETGWVTTMKLSSNRNITGVLAWNIADDVGQMLIARYLRRRRGLVGKVAPGINFARGLVHFDCGVQNLLFARAHNNASTWQFRLPNETTLYPGPRWWGRQ